jgi:hypothetical protein
MQNILGSFRGGNVPKHFIIAVLEHIVESLPVVPAPNAKQMFGPGLFEIRIVGKQHRRTGLAQPSWLSWDPSKRLQDFTIISPYPYTRNSTLS